MSDFVAWIVIFCIYMLVYAGRQLVKNRALASRGAPVWRSKRFSDKAGWHSQTLEATRLLLDRDETVAVVAVGMTRPNWLYFFLIGPILFAFQATTVAVVTETRLLLFKLYGFRSLRGELVCADELHGVRVLKANSGLFNSLWMSLGIRDSAEKIRVTFSRYWSDEAAWIARSLPSTHHPQGVRLP